MNKYYFGTFIAFILLLLISLNLGNFKDKIDCYKLRHQKIKDFDFMQFYLIKFRKEGFEKQIYFWKLFLYLLKVIKIYKK